MLYATRVGWACLLCLAHSLAVHGQTSARLKTSDTDLTLEAGATAPRIVSLEVPGQPKWQVRASEVLISSVTLSAKETPVSWSFNREASQIGEERVVFVYDSASPHLRLTWEWRTSTLR